ncbi:class I SAM-dependent methyltransferase [Larsenimonas salina]|uniref:class I SAM-dependent methyltransferase n=1 Tax=Larsenimonas salina TaxID=1295565 RepID=UPI0020737AE5|nr:methyltransferase domain-containing protein [Larsenimonas salina]MCM5703372.1 class I SAM-dependent methyltransferase [Larsenimonas salina]
MSNLEHLMRPSGPWAEWYARNEAFWAEPGGQRLLRNERAVLGPRLEQARGRFGLELSSVDAFLDAAPVGKRIYWAPSVEHVAKPSSLVCFPTALPLPDASMDAVVLHHMLESMSSPHQVLKEAARVTSDKGRLFVVAWNPLGASRFSGRYLSALRRESRTVWRTAQQLGDWLAFVDFKVVGVHYCNFPSAFRKEGRFETLGRRYNMPLGADSFVIEASRKGVPVQPIPVRQALGKWLPASFTNRAGIACDGVEPGPPRAKKSGQ